MLTVVETQTLHDGEPAQWWEWTEKQICRPVISTPPHRGSATADAAKASGPAAKFKHHKPEEF